ncbi:GCC2 and GCC3 [Babesia microti strain RI]|uniref:GCC2 and GCC3 n=1 Tax=Babesia microti (strain RI) TaxID=1133968 RepID=I7J9S2_BABMR|nr:GCC2 and GCC3 [Babesia microti strain RI]CCF73454.1 GCC2 and GCC3 [Babesia microti strain RI]|eukprot:XP_012648063.1 GCC2 and GCC3 [Babesia microti strain RI]
MGSVVPKYIRACGAIFFSLGCRFLTTFAAIILFVTGLGGSERPDVPIYGTHDYIAHARAEIGSAGDKLILCEFNSDCIICLDDFKSQWDKPVNLTDTISLKSACNKDSQSSFYSNIKKTNVTGKSLCYLAEWTRESTPNFGYIIYHICHASTSLVQVLVAAPFELKVRQYSTGYIDILMSGVVLDYMEGQIEYCDDKSNPVVIPIGVSETEEGIFAMLRVISKTRKKACNRLLVTPRAAKKQEFPKLKRGFANSVLFYTISNTYKVDKELWWDPGEYWVVMVEGIPKEANVNFMVVSERSRDGSLSYCGNKNPRWHSQVHKSSYNNTREKFVCKLNHPNYIDMALICACILPSCSEPINFNILVDNVLLNGDKLTYARVDPFGVVSVYQLGGHTVSTSIALVPAFFKKCSNATSYIRYLTRARPPLYLLPLEFYSDLATTAKYSASSSLALNGKIKLVENVEDTLDCPPYDLDNSFQNFINRKYHSVPLTSISYRSQERERIYIDNKSILTFQPNFSFYYGGTTSMHESLMIPHFHFGGNLPYMVCECASSSRTGCGAPSDFIKEAGVVTANPLYGSFTEIRLNLDRAVFVAYIDANIGATGGLFKVVCEGDSIGVIVSANFGGKKVLPGGVEVREIISAPLQLHMAVTYMLYFFPLYGDTSPASPKADTLGVPFKADDYISRLKSEELGQWYENPTTGAWAKAVKYSALSSGKSISIAKSTDGELIKKLLSYRYQLLGNFVRLLNTSTFDSVGQTLKKDFDNAKDVCMGKYCEFVIGGRVTKVQSDDDRWQYLSTFTTPGYYEGQLLHMSSGSNSYLELRGRGLVFYNSGAVVLLKNLDADCQSLGNTFDKLKKNNIYFERDKILKGVSNKPGSRTEFGIDGLVASSKLSKLTPEALGFTFEPPVEAGLYKVCSTVGDKPVHIGFVNAGNSQYLLIDIEPSSDVNAIISLGHIYILDDSRMSHFLIRPGNFGVEMVNVPHSGAIGQLTISMCLFGELVVILKHYHLFLLSKDMTIINQIKIVHNGVSSRPLAVFASAYLIYVSFGGEIHSYVYDDTSRKLLYKGREALVEGIGSVSWFSVNESDRGLKLFILDNVSRVFYVDLGRSRVVIPCDRYGICPYTRFHQSNSANELYVIYFYAPLLTHMGIMILDFAGEVVGFRRIPFDEQIVTVDTTGGEFRYLALSHYKASTGSGAGLVYRVMSLSVLSRVSVSYPTLLFQLKQNVSFRIFPRIDGNFKYSYEWLNREEHTGSGIFFYDKKGMIYGTPNGVGNMKMLIRVSDPFGHIDMEVEFFVNCASGFTLKSSDSEAPGVSETKFICDKCAIGSYYDKASKSCIKCAENSTTETNLAYNKSFCLCSPGHYLKGGKCLPCEAGTFKEVLGNSPCYGRCPPNTHSSVTGATGLAQLGCVCNPGYYKSGEGGEIEQVCLACNEGFYCPGGTHKKVKCPEFMSTEGPGASSLEDCMCNPGYRKSSEGGECVPCDYLSYKETLGNSNCLPCTVHGGDGMGASFSMMKASTSILNCKYCSFGYYKRNGQCMPCPKGMYCRRAIIPCGPNMTTRERSSTSPLDCMCMKGYGLRLGSRNPLTGLAKCEPCKRGTFQHLDGADIACLPCPAGSTTLYEGATSFSDCVPIPGFYISEPPPKPKGDEASKDKASKDEASKDKASKDEASKDEASKDKASKDKASKDKASKDKASKDKASKDKASKDKASKDKASKDEDMEPLLKCGSGLLRPGEYSTTILRTTLKDCIEECKINIYCTAVTFSMHNVIPALSVKGFTNALVHNIAYWPCKLEFFGRPEIDNPGYLLEENNIGSSDNHKDLVFLGSVSCTFERPQQSWMNRIFVPCKKDHYCTGQSYPIPCPSNSVTMARGASTPEDCMCVSGFHPSTAGSERHCVPCPVGHYKSNTSNASCTPCGDNMTTISTGSHSFSQCTCLPIYYAVQTEATAAVLGTGAAGGVKCVRCPSSYYCLGYWMETTFQRAHAFPQPCPNNSQMPNDFLDHSAPTSCRCLPGYSVTSRINGIVTCNKCPRGTFKNALGNSPCNGFCMALSTSYLGSRVEAQCFCRYGSYLAITPREGVLGLECVKCLEGGICLGGFVNLPGPSFNPRSATTDGENAVGYKDMFLVALRHSRPLPRFGYYPMHIPNSSHHGSRSSLWTPSGDYKTSLTQDDWTYDLSPEFHACVLPERCPGFFGPACVPGTQGYLCSLCNSAHDTFYYGGPCVPCRPLLQEILLFLLPRFVVSALVFFFLRYMRALGRGSISANAIFVKIWLLYALSVVPFGMLASTSYSSLARFTGAYRLIFYAFIYLFGLNVRVGCLLPRLASVLAQRFPIHNPFVSVWYLQRLCNVLAPMVDLLIVACVLALVGLVRHRKRFSRLYADFFGAFAVLAYLHTPMAIFNALQMSHCVATSYAKQSPLQVLLSMPVVTCNPSDPFFRLGLISARVIFFSCIIYWTLVVYMLCTNKNGTFHRLHGFMYSRRLWDIFLQLRCVATVYLVAAPPLLDPSGDSESLRNKLNLMFFTLHLSLHIYNSPYEKCDNDILNGIESLFLVTNVVTCTIFHWSYYYDLRGIAALPIAASLYSHLALLRCLFIGHENRRRFGSILSVPGVSVESASWHWFVATCLSHHVKLCDARIYLDYKSQTLLIEPSYYSFSGEWKDEIARYRSGSRPLRHRPLGPVHISSLIRTISESSLISGLRRRSIDLPHSAQFFIVRYAFWYSFSRKLNNKHLVFPEAIVSRHIFTALFRRSGAVSGGRLELMLADIAKLGQVPSARVLCDFRKLFGSSDVVSSRLAEIFPWSVEELSRVNDVDCQLIDLLFCDGLYDWQALSLIELDEAILSLKHLGTSRFIRLVKFYNLYRFTIERPKLWQLILSNSRLTNQIEANKRAILDSEQIMCPEDIIETIEMYYSSEDWKNEILMLERNISKLNMFVSMSQHAAKLAIGIRAEKDALININITDEEILEVIANCSKIHQTSQHL